MSYRVNLNDMDTYLFPYVKPLNDSPETFLGFSNSVGIDVYAGGVISGIVDISGSVKSGCKVCLYHEESGELISTTSTDSTGKFEFTNINKAHMYYVVVKAPNNQWERKVSSRRVPV